MNLIATSILSDRCRATQTLPIPAPDDPEELEAVAHDVAFVKAVAPGTCPLKVRRPAEPSYLGRARSVGLQCCVRARRRRARRSFATFPAGDTLAQSDEARSPPAPPSAQPARPCRARRTARPGLPLDVHRSRQRLRPPPPHPRARAPPRSAPPPPWPGRQRRSPRGEKIRRGAGKARTCRAPSDAPPDAVERRIHDHAGEAVARRVRLRPSERAGAGEGRPVPGRPRDQPGARRDHGASGRRAARAAGERCARREHPPALDEGAARDEADRHAHVATERLFRKGKLASVFERKLTETSKRFARLFFESELHENSAARRGS